MPYSIFPVLCTFFWTASVFPFARCHRVSHHLRNVATRYQETIFFSASLKLSMSCNRIPQGRKKLGGEKKHPTFVEHSTGVVYKILLTCDKIYVGQTGRCINESLRKYVQSLPTRTGSHLRNTVKCACAKALFNETVMLKRSRDTIALLTDMSRWLSTHGPPVCISMLRGVSNKGVCWE